jgi:hypothetical protein
MFKAILNWFCEFCHFTFNPFRFETNFFSQILEFFYYLRF